VEKPGVMFTVSTWLITDPSAYHSEGFSHYLKLRKALTDMEDVGLIRKSVSEYASPLAMVWKEDRSLSLGTDFRWMNARTVKDAHPLPHQADFLTALGGSAFSSTMDLTLRIL
jgi:hypothetical protein